MQPDMKSKIQFTHRNVTIIIRQQTNICPLSVSQVGKYHKCAPCAITFTILCYGIICIGTYFVLMSTSVSALYEFFEEISFFGLGLILYYLPAVVGSTKVSCLPHQDCREKTGSDQDFEIYQFGVKYQVFHFHQDSVILKNDRI